jgi:hypothetical protein
MKYPILASFILFIIILRHNIRKATSQQEKEEKEFWQKEAEANSTRRKPLDDLEYVKVPMEEFPTDVLADSDTVRDCVNLLKGLAEEPIVNLTGFTNTELKLRYGAPSITELTRYDENYTLLVQTLQKWANFLWEKGETEAAVKIMEYEVSIKADVSAAYRKLATHYKSTGHPERVEDLIRSAEELRSLSRNSILAYLKEASA